MATITIKSVEFNGLALEIECDREGMTEARFMSSGNRIPKSMYARLERNSADQREISDEFAAYRFYGDN